MASTKVSKKALEAEDERLRDYELVLIINPEIVDEALNNTIDKVSRFITETGVISDVEHWGKRKLAYPIKHFLEGSYVLIRFKLSPTLCKELEAKLEVSEEVLRHLLIKLSG